MARVVYETVQLKPWVAADPQRAARVLERALNMEFPLSQSICNWPGRARLQMMGMATWDPDEDDAQVQITIEVIDGCTAKIELEDPDSRPLFRRVCDFLPSVSSE